MNSFLIKGSGSALRPLLTIFLSSRSRDHVWCYFHFNPPGNFPEDWEREKANSGIYWISSSFITCRKQICENSQISTQPGQGPTLCLNSVFSSVTFSWQSPREGSCVSNITTSAESQSEALGENYCETRRQLPQIKSNYMINFVSPSPKPQDILESSGDSLQFIYSVQ